MKAFFDNMKYGIVGLAALILIITAIPPTYPTNRFQFDKFAALPAIGGGRIKALDTEARVNLMAISGRQSFKVVEKTTDGAEKTTAYPAIKWLLDVMTSHYYSPDPEAAKFKIFRIEDSELLSALGLAPRHGPFAYEEFQAKLNEVGERLKKTLKEKEEENLSPQEKHLVNEVGMLGSQTRKIFLLSSGPAANARIFHIENDQLLQILGLTARKGFQYSLLEILPKYDELESQIERAGQVEEKNWDLFDRKVMDLARGLKIYQTFANWGAPHAVPPAGKGGPWQTLAEAERKGNPAFGVYKVLFEAYVKDNVERFNEMLGEYSKALAKEYVVETGSAHFEVFFNHFAPFEKCALFYALVFLLICLSWFGYTEQLQTSAFWLAVFLAGVHTLALIFRIYLTGRPPVTNLYSSAVFIGWGCVLLCLFLEWIFNNGLGTMVASILGGLTLIIAHNLAASGDTMEVLVAVLDTNFWLATHVVCITLGYTATFVTGFFGIAYVIKGVFTPSLDRETAVNLTKMTYGTACFATLLSFTGTVLGGIWADQSWGRFWGWDPKENGALIIVLWNALLLHARWGGLVKGRGLANLAIGGNIVTAWSWFGVNMLGVGLHSYGFMSGAVFWMAVFVASQVVLIGTGCLPEKYWKSLNVQAQRFAPPAVVKPALSMPNGDGAPSPTSIKQAKAPSVKSSKVKVKN